MRSGPPGGMLEELCHECGLVDVSDMMVFRFSEPATPLKPVLLVHSFVRDGGQFCLKATCQNRNHGKCVCWITKPVSGLGIAQLLSRLVHWGAANVSEEEHHRLGHELKLSYGMKPRVR